MKVSIMQLQLLTFHNPFQTWSGCSPGDGGQFRTCPLSLGFLLSHEEPEAVDLTQLKRVNGTEEDKGEEDGDRNETGS